MPEAHFIDTFPAFLNFWSEVRDRPLEAQIDAWAADYMSGWRDLLQKQQEDYANEKIDWREIARERVFPFLGERLPVMRQAHQNLTQVWAPVLAAAREALDFESSVTFVVYVGIGCGAGWATRFRGTPAVLFGLENIAECGWSERQALRGLVAHEIGHLAHEGWRAEREMPQGSGPWWQLYSEGLAQRCEHLVLGADTWHMNSGVDNAGWLVWCQAHQGWLAAEFLRNVDAGESVRPFFGSWYKLRGYSQCGYYLGHQLIAHLERELTLGEIALLEGDDARLRRALEELAGRDA
jgi:hypothetical protein